MYTKIFSAINIITPKNKKQIFFSSTCPFRDNVTAVLDELLKHEISNEYRIILDGTGFETYKGENITRVKHSSIKSIILYLTSKYVFYNNGIYANKHMDNQITVNVWHGMPLKKIGYFNAEEGIEISRLSTYTIAESDFFRESMAKAFGIPEENVLVTGNPRNDYLFFDNYGINQFGIDKNEYKKILVWMPTYRISKTALSKNDGAEYEFGIPLLNHDNIKTLNGCLKEENNLLIIKYHSLQNISLPENVELSNILFLTSEQVAETGRPLYEFVAQCDALITDYSSIYFDYLLLNKPICFAYDDYEIYCAKRGFVFDDVKTLMPGFHAESFERLIEFIRENNAGVDLFSKEREEYRLKFNKYLDDKSSYRVLKYVNLI